MISARAAEIDAASGLHGFDAERQAQVAFAGSRRPDQMQGLGAVDELQLGERHDAVPVERGLEREVEAGEGLDGGEPRHDEGHLHAPVLAQGELLGKQRVDSFEGVHFAALDPAHRGVEDFDGAWHFQANQAPLDAVDDGHLGPRSDREWRRQYGRQLARVVQRLTCGWRRGCRSLRLRAQLCFDRGKVFQYWRIKLRAPP